MQIRLILLFILLSVRLIAQPAEYRMSREEYIEKYKDEAVKEMMMSKIPASIILAQALLETGDGNSPLAKYANNHFGIKCHGWKEFSYNVDDDALNECFRKYSSVIESYSDHSKFLKTRPWYKPLFELKLTDYEGWARGLKAAGYATLPEYADLLIRIIEEHKLYQLDHFDTLRSRPAVASLDRSLDLHYSKELIVTSKLKHVITKPGDSYTRLALKYNISMKKLHEYNDLPRDAKLKPGMIMYLEPKLTAREEIEYHLTQNESVYEIAQIHGVKVSALQAMNPWLSSRKPVQGDIIRLNSEPPFRIEEPVQPLATLFPSTMK